MPATIVGARSGCRPRYGLPGGERETGDTREQEAAGCQGDGVAVDLAES